MTSAQPRRRADAERNIDTIIEATRDLLSAGTLPPMTAVAAAARVGRVTLYSHFPTRELLLDAVLRRAVTDTDQALTALDLDQDPPAVGLSRLIRTSWPVLDRYRTVRALALSQLDPESLHAQHQRIVHHVEKLIVRGQNAGEMRTDLPRDWLIATFYATLHAAADEVSAGRLDHTAAPDVLVATLSSTFGTERAVSDPAGP